MHKTRIPDSTGPDFPRQLIEFGHLLETQARPGCCFDLRQWPNLLWQTIEKRMLSGWLEFTGCPACPEKILMLQWYNSGVFFRVSGKIIGCDIVPVPRYYGWPDQEELTRRIAEKVDILLVTHNHADHYDDELVRSCLDLGKPVLMHPDASDLEILRMADGATAVFGDIQLKARHCCHVWRRDAAEVPLTCFEITCAQKFRMIFCGDADYTKGFGDLRPRADVLFITWRNPGPRFEDGHPEQQAKTADAVRIAIDELAPGRIVLQHYAELDHVYRGFPASYELAVALIEQLPLPVSIHFWGDVVQL